MSATAAGPIPDDPSHQLSLDTAPGPHGPVVALTGDLDYESAPLLLDALPRIDVTAGGTVTLDLAAVRFFDSGGINALLRARTALQERGAGLTVRRLSPVVERIFRITGLDTVLVPETDSDTDAVAG
ncbi:STAS domain-containing protein [Streptomyces sp. NPDC050095]|uniref:STAS domain-containing protein n=1 Tax=unclassified Streptomyces TaxID=2593676 RepID=UPI00342C0CBA